MNQDFIPRLARVLSAVLVGFTVVLVGYVGVNIGHTINESQPNPTTAAAPMLEVAPGGVLNPADMSEALAVHYNAAETHADLYETIPCYCGCDAFLGHRHLLDCFVRADGSGWEAHAAGCGVCLGESQQIQDLLAAGETDPAVIRDAVIAQWGDPFSTR